jgi:tetratricopeptide (TPR) repeat protein
MLTLWAYVAYVRRPSWKGYGAVAGFLAIGLMAKPMLVTVPLTLLLLDFWPLRRSMSAALIKEKLPLFALAAASSVITIVVQRQAGAVMQLGQVSIGVRVANALVAYVRYIGKMLWPTNLVAMYPLPRELPPTELVVGALAILAAITLLAVFAARRHPYLIVGWLWYVVTLVPVIGIVQVGAQSIADRYTYVPFIGLFVMIAWGVPAVVGATSLGRRGLQVASVVTVLVCTVLSIRQVQAWRNSLALWQHAVDTSPDNYFAQSSLGYVLWKGGDVSRAMERYNEAIRLRPDFAEAHNNLGVALAGQGRPSEALPHFSEALRLKPGYAVAQNNLTATTERLRAGDEGLARYANDVRDRPNDMAARNEFGAALFARGHFDEAIREFEQALRIDPAQPDIHYNLGMVLDQKGRTRDALEQFRTALRQNPKHEPARDALKSISARTTDGVRK